MKTNRNLLLWKKNTLCLFNIVFAFFTIIGWQVSESSAQDWATCIKPVNIPDEIDVLILGQESEEKTLINETDDDWFQYYFANEEDDTNPDTTDTNGEDHSIDIQTIDEDFYTDDDLSWEVYDRNGICVARGKSGERFGPSFEDLTPPPGADPLPSDTYFIRIIWDPEDDIEFENGDGRLSYSLTLNGQGVPQVYGTIKNAVSGKKLSSVTVNSSIHEVDSYDKPAPIGEYMLHAKDKDDVLTYNLDGYQPGEVKNFDFKGGIDHLLQNVILCPNDDDVALTATPSSGDPLTVTFDLLPDVTNPEVSADYDWDFGDGMSSVSPDPVSHTYSDPGTYMVDVTVSLTLPQQKVKVNNIEYLTKEVECTVESSVDVIVGGDPSKPKAEIIGTWSNGIYYWDFVASDWTKMDSDTTTGDIAAGDFSGDGRADVASIWPNNLWYQDGDTLDWIQIPKIDSSPPFRVTAGDVTGDGRAEIIATWDSGLFYWDEAASKYTEMEADPPTGDIAAGDFNGDGIADVAAIYNSGLWYIDGATFKWKKVDNSPPFNLTAGDVTGDGRAEIIATWNSGLFYYDVAKSKYKKMEADPPTGDIAAGDFNGDGIADVAAIYNSGLWYINGATFKWKKVDNSPPFSLTAGDVTGN